MLECSSMEYQGSDCSDAICWFLYLQQRTGSETKWVDQLWPPGSHWSSRIFGSPVLTGVNGAVRIGTREVKFLDRAKTNLSEGIPQVFLH